MNEMVKGMGRALVASMAITLLGIGICAWLISAETIKPAAGEYCIIAILLLASFAGAKLAIAKNGENRLATGILAGTTYYATLLAVTALLFDGQYHGVGYTALIVFSGTVAAVITGKRGQNRTSTRKSRIRHR